MPGTSWAQPSPAVAVVVQGTPGGESAVVRAVRSAGGQVVRSLPIVDGVAARVRADRVGTLGGAAGVRAVAPDRRVSFDSTSPLGYDPVADFGSLYDITQIIGAQSSWMAGYTGQGVDVALIDTGVAPVQGLTSGNVVNGPDLSFDSQAQQSDR